MWLAVAACIVVAIAIICKLTNISTKLYVWIITETQSNYAHRYLVQLFHQIENKTDLTIIEFGAGGGGNFPYYPIQSKVTCVEPVCEFDEHLQQSIQKNGRHLKSVDVVRNGVEELISIMNESVADYVVCTYVLCSVQDVNQALQSIHYLLKPGGKFLYLEHTQGGSKMMQWYQSLLTPIFSVIMKGCHYNRQPHIAIEKSGLFSECTYNLVVVDQLPSYRPERTQVWGYAVKEGEAQTQPLSRKTIA